MTTAKLLQRYINDPRLLSWVNHWAKLKPGDVAPLVGSRGSFDAVAAAVALQVSKQKIIHVLRNKEEAAYAFNDLEKLLSASQVAFFPDSYRRPYADLDLVDNANIGRRAAVLQQFQHSKPFIVITYPEAICEKVITKSTLKGQSLRITRGENIGLDLLNESLFAMNFQRVDFVTEPGQFAVRGGIVDVFSYASNDPHRIEFFDDEVDSLRTFAVDSQLSIQAVKSMQLVANVEDKQITQRESLWDHAGSNCLLWIGDIPMTSTVIDKVCQMAEEAYLGLDSLVKHAEPHELYLNAESFADSLATKGIAVSKAQGDDALGLQMQPAFNKNFNLLASTLEGHRQAGSHAIMMHDKGSQRKRLEAIFQDICDKDLEIEWLEGSLHRGWEDHDLVVYSDHQIFERHQRFILNKRKNQDEAITLKDLNALKVGDFVAHVDHGVGKFGGLQTIEVGGHMQEAIKLIYQDRDLLYVSIHSLHKISKFRTKEGLEPKLHKLGSPAWQKLKKKTKTRVKQMAYDLIVLYAKRKEAKGFSFSPDSYLQHELEASFMFEDTPDQEKATADIKSDMENPIPMDRLICGDVGFGKTELAVRAAFKAVTDGKQVAILVPTTLLAFQHYNTFTKRLAQFPVRVEYLNRTRSSKDVKRILADLTMGKVDILIGTHKLVSKDVHFKDLGLLVVDEEQKFGVNIKDKLKTLKVNVDTLTLTATPIPRTMQFSLMAARDLSVMKTPPANRQPIDTQVVGFQESLIRDGIQYELSRGGQVFFINNRIQNIQEVAGMLQRLLPDANIAIGHGQMKGSELETILLDFMAGTYDILVSTTIVESGLDVPNANTIFINNAHMFGLSDLHQIRGRVGRSNKKAFCYLMAPPMSGLPDESRKRLQALEQFSDLGSGFKIAMQDLEIRGAGDLLGAEQSGFINDLGFATYQKLLAEAVEDLKTKEFKSLYADVKGGWESLSRDCQLDTDMALRLPSDYINDVEERLSIYKALNQVTREDDLRAFSDGLVDRFGQLPTEAIDLIDSMKLRWMGEAMGLEKLVLKGKKMLAYFPADPDKAPPQKVLMPFLEALQRNPSRFRMKQKNGRITLVVEAVDTMTEAMTLLIQLSPNDNLPLSS